jgi:putative transposase
MIACLVPRLAAPRQALAPLLHARLRALTKPAAAPLVGGAVTALRRSRPELLAENALLRQQVILLQRRVKRPRCTAIARALRVLRTSRLPPWRQAGLIVQPQTVLRWPRALCRRVWRRRSPPAAPAHRPPLAPETVALIRPLAAATRRWGAAHIRGALLQRDLRLAPRTIHKYRRQARPPPTGHTGATCLHHHAPAIWAADVLPVPDLLFRPRYAFCLIAVAARRVVHRGAPPHPTDAWVAQQLRAAPP